MTTHPPGPWRFTNPHQEIFAPNGKSADGSNGVTVGEVHGDFKYAQDLANARLIAAAPDMLAALKETKRGDMLSDATIVLEQAGHQCLAKALRKMRDEARAAIAKAEGAPHPQPSDMTKRTVMIDIIHYGPGGELGRRAVEHRDDIDAAIANMGPFQPGDTIKIIEREEDAAS
jgi:hypothetical protein